jgi:hypothetical protein
LWVAPQVVGAIVALALTVVGPILTTLGVGAALDRWGTWGVLAVVAALVCSGSVGRGALSGMSRLPLAGLSVMGLLALEALVYGAMLATISEARARWLVPLAVALRGGLALLNPHLWAPLGRGWGSIGVGLGVLVIVVLVSRPVLAHLADWRERPEPPRGAFRLLWREPRLGWLLLLTVALAVGVRVGAELTSAALQSKVLANISDAVAVRQAFGQAAADHFLLENGVWLGALLLGCGVVVPRLRGLGTAALVGGAGVALLAAAHFTGGTLLLFAFALGLLHAGRDVLLVAWVSQSSASIFKGRLAVEAIATLATTVTQLVLALRLMK